MTARFFAWVFFFYVGEGYFFVLCVCVSYKNNLAAKILKKNSRNVARTIGAVIVLLLCNDGTKCYFCGGSGPA